MAWPERLSYNQSTLPAESEPPLAELLAAANEAGVRGISLNRVRSGGAQFAETARAVREAGIPVIVYQTIGYWTSGIDLRGLLWSQEDSIRTLDEAAELGAHTVGVIAGGLPAPGSTRERLRERVAVGIADLARHAADRNLTLALEPLHPVFAPGHEALFFTLRHALDFLDELAIENVGLLLDTYHVWWDPELIAQLRRGRDRVLATQVNDWSPEVVDRAGTHRRAIMGDGCIEFDAFVEGLAGWDGWFDMEVIGNEELAALPLPAMFERLASSFEETIGHRLA